jgi:hypothetical protein
MGTRAKATAGRALAMKAWFSAGKEALREYYKQGFRVATLSQRQNVESIPQGDLLDGFRSGKGRGLVAG